MPTPVAGELSLFVVDTDAAGLERTLIPMEIRAPEKQFTLFFDNVEVPADRLLGDEHEGLRQVFVGLNPERIMSASICTGIGRYALDRAAAYANEREVWGVPIGRHQGIAHPLATAKIEVELARLMTAKAAWMHDHASDRVAAGEAANMAKYAAAEAGLHALDAAIQTHGGNGLASEYGLADLWGMVRLLRIAPVSREMVLNFVAQQSLGSAEVATDGFLTSGATPGRPPRADCQRGEDRELRLGDDPQALLGVGGHRGEGDRDQHRHEWQDREATPPGDHQPCPRERRQRQERDPHKELPSCVPALDRLVPRLLDRIPQPPAAKAAHRDDGRHANPVVSCVARCRGRAARRAVPPRPARPTCTHEGSQRPMRGSE